MSGEKETASLYELIGAIYERHRDDIKIAPSWLAGFAMAEIGASRDDNPRLYLAAHLQFRQIARSFCAKKHDPVESETGDLFEGTLQQRYPRPPSPDDDEPIYILRAQMSREDVRFNAARMRKVSVSLAKHAEALENWDYQRNEESAA
jgi:hypothetical protein